ncbi:MAG: succinylglutamate desuccinylase/aspartoacylase family protein [Haloarculaceae archaeon]
MRVERLGEGEPDVAIVGGIHGDEPCGVHAVETLLDERPSVKQPVKFVLANEEAMARGTRYVERDLNRSFPGDVDGETHEERIAHALSEELADCRTLALHSTQSYDGAFALASTVGAFEREICPTLSVDAVVEVTGFTEGRIFASAPRTVEVECGYQGSQTAAENAVTLTKEFLAATDVLPRAETTDCAADLPVFRLRERVPKAEADGYDVYVENFQRVDPGQPYASTGGTDHVAETTFYPVLMSAYGYENLFGYAADKVGELTA